METILKEKIKNLPLIQYNIVNYLSVHGATIRKELEDNLNIPHTTAYDNLKKLKDKKIVWKKSIQNGKRGRPRVHWLIKQAHNLVLFKAQNLVLFDKQAHNLVLSVLSDKPGKTKTKLKYGKLPAIEKKIMLKEVKHLTYVLKKLEYLKQKKPFNNEPTTSYILTNRNSELTKYVLDEINKYTYFKTPTLRNNYINNVLEAKYTDIKGNIRRSVSNRIGRIVRELNNLKIIIKYSRGTGSVWKNLYKGNLYTILDERMEQNYFMLKMKHE